MRKKRKSKKDRKKKDGLSPEFRKALGLKKPTREKPDPPITELPLTAEEIEAEKEQIIEDVFEGDKDKFFKRYYRHNKTNRIYSKIIPEWQKEELHKEAIEYILELCKYPQHVREVVNILRVLEKYYDAEFSKDNVDIAYETWELFAEDLASYSQKQWSLEVDKRGWKNVRKLTKAQAWKEQKARGFIPVKKFKDYDKGAAHVYSNIKKDYIYPMNFYHGLYRNKELPTHIYIGLSLVGVEGYTRCVIPD